MVDPMKIVDLIVDVRTAFENIKVLQEGQKHLTDRLDKLDDRLRALEKNLPIAEERIQRLALKEAGDAVQRVQGAMFDKLGDIDKRVDRIEWSRAQGDGRSLADGAGKALPPASSE